MKKIVICDDHQLFIDGIVHILSQDRNLEIVGKFTNHETCIKYIKENPVDILISDLNLHKYDGFMLLENLKGYLDNTLKIILTAYDEEYLIEKAQKLGVNCYLSKSLQTSDLLDAVKRSVEDDFYTNIKKSNFESYTEKETNFKNKFKLSGREIEIIKLVLEGKSSEKIAEEIFVSKFTVETHRRNILKKLGISGSKTLAQFAHENNIWS